MKNRKPYNTAYRYKYEDLACVYCSLYIKKKCQHPICPYILDTLDDLQYDAKFRAAVADAENCTTPHRNTLIAIAEGMEGFTLKT